MKNMETEAARDMAAAVASSRTASPVSITNIHPKPRSEAEALGCMVEIFRENEARGLPTTEEDLRRKNFSPEQIHELLPRATAIAESVMNIG